MNNKHPYWNLLEKQKRRLTRSFWSLSSASVRTKLNFPTPFLLPSNYLLELSTAMVTKSSWNFCSLTVKSIQSQRWNRTKKKTATKIHMQKKIIVGRTRQGSRLQPNYVPIHYFSRTHLLRCPFPVPTAPPVYINIVFFSLSARCTCVAHAPPCHVRLVQNINQRKKNTEAFYESLAGFCAQPSATTSL